MKLLSIFILFISALTWAQHNPAMETKFTLGETEIAIYEQKSPSADNIVFVNVHEDETTSIETLYRYTDSIHFFYLRHQWTRRIAFTMKAVNYDFDPNRIFTKKGRKKTLKDGANYSGKANKEVKKLAKAILNRLPEGHTVVAVHNNTDENYSIKSYDVGGDEAENTKSVYINPETDPDDFIYTTDAYFFNAFKKLGVNVILQDNKGYVNDGSLSVYCGKNEIPYINIETQKGHFDAQMRLMKEVLTVVRNRD
ncbi:MAG: hypothetical protein ACI8ZM_002140 [Crocinitomix sp.]|jgi:hypothetical protein